MVELAWIIEKLEYIWSNVVLLFSSIYLQLG